MSIRPACVGPALGGAEPEKAQCGAVISQHEKRAGRTFPKSTRWRASGWRGGRVESGCGNPAESLAGECQGLTGLPRRVWVYPGC